jgi:hypothetical protein
MSDKPDIDTIIQMVRRNYPLVCVQQLPVTDPADDNGIWYFWNPDHPKDDIQIESPDGQCPFLIETNRNSKQVQGETVERVVTLICEHLRTPVTNGSN